MINNWCAAKSARAGKVDLSNVNISFPCSKMDPHGAFANQEQMVV